MKNTISHVYRNGSIVKHDLEREILFSLRMPESVSDIAGAQQASDGGEILGPYSVVVNFHPGAAHNEGSWLLCGDWHSASTLFAV
jgi:hypothetical protein